MKDCGGSAKRGEIVSDCRTRGNFHRRADFELSFEECFGGGQCMQWGNGVKLWM